MEYSIGNFSFIKNQEQQKLLINAFKVINEMTCGWVDLKNFNSNKSFTELFNESWKTENILTEINKKILIDHNEMSYGWTT